MFNAYKEHRLRGAGEGREKMPTTVLENGDSKKLTGSYDLWPLALTFLKYLTNDINRVLSYL